MSTSFTVLHPTRPVYLLLADMTLQLLLLLQLLPRDHFPPVSPLVAPLLRLLLVGLLLPIPPRHLLQGGRPSLPPEEWEEEVQPLWGEREPAALPETIETLLLVLVGMMLVDEQEQEEGEEGMGAAVAIATAVIVAVYAVQLLLVVLCLLLVPISTLEAPPRLLPSSTRTLVVAPVELSAPSHRERPDSRLSYE